MCLVKHTFRQVRDYQTQRRLVRRVGRVQRQQLPVSLTGHDASPVHFEMMGRVMQCFLGAVGPSRRPLLPGKTFLKETFLKKLLAFCGAVGLGYAAT